MAASDLMMLSSCRNLQRDKLLGKTAGMPDRSSELNIWQHGHCLVQPFNIRIKQTHSCKGNPQPLNVQHYVDVQQRGDP